MSECEHGFFLGVGCKKCRPQPKTKVKMSEEKKQILKTSMLILARMQKEADPVKKAQMEKDWQALMRMRHHF